MDASLLSRINGEWLQTHFKSNDAINAQTKSFFDVAKRSLRSMELASQMSDLVGWKFHASAIKIAATKITARRIVSLCEEAESMLSLSATDGTSLIYHFEKELVILRHELDQLVAA
jgi:hypothetical protein